MVLAVGLDVLGADGMAPIGFAAALRGWSYMPSGQRQRQVPSRLESEPRITESHKTSATNNPADANPSAIALTVPQ